MSKQQPPASAKEPTTHVCLNINVRPLHHSVLERTIDHLHSDSLRKQNGLNLSLCVPRLDVGVRFMDIFCLLKWTCIEPQITGRFAFRSKMDPTINHSKKIPAHCERHAAHLECKWSKLSTTTRHVHHGIIWKSHVWEKSHRTSEPKKQSPTLCSLLRGHWTSRHE